MVKASDLWSSEQIENLYVLVGQGNVEDARDLISLAGDGVLPENAYPFSLRQLWDSCLQSGSVEMYELLKSYGVTWEVVHEESLKSLRGEEFDDLLGDCVVRTNCTNPDDIKKLLFAVLDDGYRFVGSSPVTGLDETYAMFQDDIEVFQKLDKARFPLCPDNYPVDTYGHHEYVQFWLKLFETGHVDLAAFLMHRGYALPPELQSVAEQAGIADTLVDEDRKPRKLVDVARAAALRATLAELESAGAVNGEGELQDGSSLVDDGGIAIVPDGVKRLGEGAFSHNNSLKAILIPPSLKAICKDALSDLPKLVGVAMYSPDDLDSLVLDEGVFSFGNVAVIDDWPWVLDGIDEYRFGSAMASVSISDVNIGLMKSKRSAVSVDEGNSVFRSKAGMLLSKDGKALLYCPNEDSTSGSDTLLVPEGVEALGPRALKSAPYSHVKLPKSLRKIGLEAFAGMPLLDIEIPGGVGEYDASDSFSPAGAFQFCEALGNVTICDGVEVIPPGMFKYCNGLLECLLPSSLRAIGDEAFCGCRNLELTVPDGVLEIGPRAFGSGILSSVRSVSLPANLPNRDYAAICGQANGALVLRRTKEGDGYDLAVYLPDDNDEAEPRGTLEELWETWSSCSVEKGLAAQDRFFLDGRFKRFYTKIRIAIARLAVPTNLSDEAFEKYRKYLDENLSKAKQKLNCYEGRPFLKLLKIIVGESSESERAMFQSDGVVALGAEVSPLDIDLKPMWNIQQAGEPNYVGPNGRVSASAAALLFAQDYVFFNSDDITWDGKHHGISGMQFNIAQRGDAPTLFSNRDMVLRGIADMLLDLERDESLRVPISAIHPGLHGALRYDDLTPLTLFNLQTFARAMQICQVGDDAYLLVHDVRLSRGIPDFYNIVARLVWDMRAYNEIGGPFVVNFVSSINVDANQYFEQFDNTVAGAVNHAAWLVVVADLPQITVPVDSDEIAIPGKGVSEGTGWRFVTYEPSLSPDHDAFDQMETDVNSFEDCILSTIWEMPMDSSVEGTGYLDRNSHIEGISVGDPLVLVADWQSPYHGDNMAIEVFDAKGRTLGLLSIYSGMEKGALACMLPHITASVANVTPLSARKKNAKYALLDVHMEIDDGLYDEDEEKPVRWLFEEIDAVLAKDAPERVLLSKGPLSLNDLQGAVDVSRAIRTANEQERQKEELLFAFDGQPVVSGSFTISKKDELGSARETDGLQFEESPALRAARKKAEQAKREAEERAERERREAKREAKQTAPAAVRENERLAKEVLKWMPEGRAVLTSEIMEHVNGIMTSQKCTKVMNVLIEEGKVERVDGVKGRYIGYQLSSGRGSATVARASRSSASSSSRCPGQSARSFNNDSTAGKYSELAKEESQEDAELANGNNSVTSLAEELTQLKALLEQGVLTQEEYDEQKARVLNGTRQNKQGPEVPSQVASSRLNMAAAEVAAVSQAKKKTSVCSILAFVISIIGLVVFVLGFFADSSMFDNLSLMVILSWMIAPILGIVGLVQTLGKKKLAGKGFSVLSILIVVVPFAATVFYGMYGSGA